MLKFAICDDQIEWVIKTKGLLQKFCLENEIQVEVETYTDPSNLDWKNISKNDVLFLDVEMQEYNGIQIGEKIREFNKDILLIYISSYIEYATFGYSVKAFRYLLKSNVETTINECMLAVVKQLKLQEEMFEVKMNSEKIFIPLNKIIYIMGNGRKIIVKTNDELNPEYEFYSMLSEQEANLKEKGFLRIQKGYLVNMEYISSMKNYTAYISNGEQISISKDRYTFLREQYALWRGK